MASRVEATTPVAEDAVQPDDPWVDWVVLAGVGVFAAWAAHSMWAHPRPPKAPSTGASFGAEAAFRVVKLLDIGYVVGLYIAAGVACGIALSHVVPPFDPRCADRQPLSFVLRDVILHFWMISMLVYALRQIAEIFPSPLHGLAGFDHYRLKELNQPALFMVVLTQTQSTLLARLAYLIRRAQRAR